MAEIPLAALARPPLATPSPFLRRRMRRQRSSGQRRRGLGQGPGVGDALRFDGNDYISIPDDKSLHPQRLTVEAWAKRDGSPGQFKHIVAKGGDGCEALGVYSSATADRVLRLRRQEVVPLNRQRAR